MLVQVFQQIQNCRLVQLRNFRSKEAGQESVLSFSSLSPFLYVLLELQGLVSQSGFLVIHAEDDDDDDDVAVHTCVVPV